MANKKVSQLGSKPSVLNTDIVPIADPSTGQLFKTTLSALGAVIGSAVASVNGLVGVVVLDTDDIQELASPTNRWFTDTRARAALSGGTGISYNSGTGVITSSVTLADLGGVPTSRTLTINGTAFDLSANRSWSIDSMVYPGAGIPISTGSAWGTSIANNSGNWNTAFSWGNHAGLYLPIGGGTLTGALLGTTASFTGRITANHSSAGDYAAVLYNSSATGEGVIVRGGSSGSNNALIVQTYNGASTLFYVLANGDSAFSGNVTANSFVKTGGLSTGFLKADGSVDSRTFATTGNLGDYLPLTGGALLNNPSSAYVLTVTNNSTASGANGLNVSIATGSTGNPFKVDKGGVTLFNVDNLGAALLKSTITAISFIKSSGTSSEFLKADGSVDNNTYVSSSALSAYLPLSGGTLTGALGGTSATFSGQVNAASKYTWGSSTTGTTGQIATDGTNNYFDYIGSLIFRGAAASNTLVTFTNAGAATFSSSVTAKGTGSYNGFVADNSSSATIGGGYYAASSFGIQRGIFGVAGAISGTADNNIAIFAEGSLGIKYFVNGSGTASHIMTASGNVGIGTASPAYKLTVVGDVRGYKLYGGEAGVGAGNYTIFSNDDNVGYIDTVRAVNSGDFQFRFSGTSRVTISTGGNVTATAFFESSDSRLKTLIKDNYQGKGIESVTAKLYTKNGVTELGYYAQDVQGILPSAVATGADGYLNLSYREVHTAKIARLEKRVEELEAQLNLI